MALQNSTNRVTEKRIEAVAMIGTPYHQTSTANVAAIISIAAPGAGKSLQLNSLIFSYDKPPTGASLEISNGSGTKYAEVAITASGAGPAIAGIKVPANTPLQIFLSAGGAGVIGRISASVTVV